MPRTSSPNLLAIATLAALAAPPAQADWPAFDWRAGIWGETRNCIGCSAADQARFQAESARNEAVKAWLVSEARAIAAWLEGLGFDAPAFDPSPLLLATDDARLTEEQKTYWQNAYANYAPTGIELAYDTFVTAALASDPPYPPDRITLRSHILSHEIMHGVQGGLGVLDGAALWIREGMAQAAGQAWTLGTQGEVVGRQESYSEPLTDSDGAYALGPFFRKLGEDMGSPGGIGYFVRLFATSPVDGHDGLRWLDQGLAAEGGLAAAYPRFIARHANQRDQFARDRFDAVITPQPVLATGQTLAIDRISRDIDRVATRYNEVAPKFLDNWGTLPEADRLYATVVSIPSADRPADLRLIVGARVLAADTHFVAPVMAAEGTVTPPLKVRVTNVAEAAEDSAAQGYDLLATTGQVRLVPPDCIEPGSTVTLEVDSPLDPADAAEALHQANLGASAGTIGPGPAFTAPASEQTVTLTATVPKTSGSTARLTLAELHVMRDCMVWMTMNDVTATYTGQGDFTEFSISSESVRMYLKQTDIAVHESGRWVPFPAGAKAMLLPKMNEQALKSMGGSILDPVAGTGIEPFTMARMPRIYARRFAWANLRHGRFPDGAPERGPAACPDGGGGCSQTAFVAEGIPVSVTFDRALRPVAILLPEVTLGFSYGSFDITRPPGW